MKEEDGKDHIEKVVVLGEAGWPGRACERRKQNVRFQGWVSKKRKRNEEKHMFVTPPPPRKNVMAVRKKREKRKHKLQQKIESPMKGTKSI